MGLRLFNTPVLGDRKLRKIANRFPTVPPETVAGIAKLALEEAFSSLPNASAVQSTDLVSTLAELHKLSREKLQNVRQQRNHLLR